MLPNWFTEYRPGQQDAIDEILEAFEDVDLVVLSAPTGSGKTLIAESVRQKMQVRGLYVCTTKQLQQQFTKDFPEGRVLQGRANYEVQEGVWADDCTKTMGDGCMWCPSVHDCPYEVAKHQALKADLAVLNTSYFLTECNGPGRFAGRPLVTIDECDMIEHELMGNVELRLSAKRLKKWKLEGPKFVTKAESWMEWCHEAKTRVRAIRLGAVRGSLSNVQVVREIKRCDHTLARLAELEKGLVDNNWVYTGNQGSVAFKPVAVSNLGQSKLWQHGKKWLLMSATPPWVEDLGWEREYRTVRLPSTFPVENRRVLIRPAWEGNRKNRNDEEVKRLTDAVSTVLARHPQERVLVHSVSYDLSKAITGRIREVGRPVFTHATAGDRSGALIDYLRTEGAVLVSPSFERGVDLPGAACRVQVIAKVPYPNLGDRQVSARLYSLGGRTWYQMNTIRTMVQMTGRGVRSADDWCVTYVLDKGFVELWRQGKRWMPEWWERALVWR